MYKVLEIDTETNDIQKTIEVFTVYEAFSILKESYTNEHQKIILYYNELEILNINKENCSLIINNLYSVLDITLLDLPLIVKICYFIYTNNFVGLDLYLKINNNKTIDNVSFISFKDDLVLCIDDLKKFTLTIKDNKLEIILIDEQNKTRETIYQDFSNIESFISFSKFTDINLELIYESKNINN